MRCTYGFLSFTVADGPYAEHCEIDECSAHLELFSRLAFLLHRSMLAQATRVAPITISVAIAPGMQVMKAASMKPEDRFSMGQVPTEFDRQGVCL